MRIVTFLVTFLSAVSIVRANTQPAASVVKEVTIYKRGAQISREANVSLAAGRTELVFKDLSPQIVAKSVQVRAEDDVMLLSVAFRLNYLEQGPEKDKEIKRLTEEIETLTRQINLLREEAGVYTKEESLLSKNQTQILGVGNNASQVQELRELADFQRARLKELIGLQADLDLRINKLNKQLMALQKQITELSTGVQTATGEIVAIVQTNKAQTSRFSFSYYMANAGWTPVYDVRIKDVSNPVKLAQKANLYQLSGENWTNVQLSLSTGDPGENGIRPDLQPWHLNFYNPYVSRAPQMTSSIGGRYQITGYGLQGEVRGRVMDDAGEPLIGATVSAQGYSVGAVTDANGNFTLKLPAPNVNLMVSYTGFSSLSIPLQNNGGQVMNIFLGSASVLSEVVVTGYAGKKRKAERTKEQAPPPPPPVTVSQLPTTLLYKIDIPVTLPSDGKLQLIDIKNYELPATYQYYCAPKLDPNVYLTALMTEWESLGLLSGEANLFFEGTYLGRTALNFDMTEDTLALSLGRDRNITVARTKQKDFSKRQLLGGKIEATRSFEIALKNKKSQSVSLMVEDQFPISDNKEISIDRGNIEGGQVEDLTGIITWTLSLDSSKEKKLHFNYKVKYPKEQQVVLE
jgi:hypothetical protein